MKYEMVTIYRNLNCGSYRVQPMCRHPTGAAAEYGAPTLISTADFDSRIVAVVLENLAKYHRAQYSSEEAPKYADKEYRRFVREHDGITVTRLETGRVEVNPWRHEKGGYLGMNSQMIVLESHEVPDRLASVIQEAFRRAE